MGRTVLRERTWVPDIRISCMDFFRLIGWDSVEGKATFVDIEDSKSPTRYKPTHRVHPRPVRILPLRCTLRLLCHTKSRS